MARWEPGTPERLQQAALELFTKNGFEQTTATDIARAVGVTERTFYRHFPDKREVLFRGQDQFLDAFTDAVAAAPAEASAMQTVAAAVRTGAEGFPDDRRAWSRMRQTVIGAHPSLQERERHKLAGLATSISAALQARGIGELPATLAAEIGATVFGLAFAQWIRNGETRSLPILVTDVLDELTTIITTAGTPR